MLGKVLILIYAVKVGSAVFIDTSDIIHHHNKKIINTHPQGWQIVQVYHQPHALEYKHEPYAYPKYEYEYSVSDKKTGDHKHHHEARDGDRVHGEYSLVESNGSLRKVQYHADDHSGFNAIVSKTVNNHGDHAVSVSDHTRFFYPVGHNLKINHYFPGKDYFYNNIEKCEENSKPVREDTIVAPNKDVKMLVIESGDKPMIVGPVQFDEKVKESSSVEEASKTKSDVMEKIPVESMPTVVSMKSDNGDENEMSLDLKNTVPLVQKDDVLPNMSAENDSQKVVKEDKGDSEVASSYYHSKFYYFI